ncbi:MAG TPA: outer membrane beta-barrel protein [Draconibacterium sp.]|nr:outer membrane beta-barrel protein [Draconibacterium sp.]
MIVLIFTILLFNTVSVAQETDSIKPIRKNAEEILKSINLNSDGFNFWKDKFSGHWAGIDLGFNTFLNPDYTGYESNFMKNDILRSNSVHLNLIQQSIGLQRNRNNFGLVTGLGLQFQDYRLEDTTTIVRIENDVIVPQSFYYSENQKSRLFLFSITLPVLAEIQIPINNYRNRLYFSSGMYFSYRIGSYTKIKYQTEYKEKLKVTDNYSLQNFKYGIMARTGYRWINFFAMYEMTSFFQEEKGPKLTPFTFGITLLQF